MKLYKSKKLLNIDNNPKTIKGQKYKIMTAILYLAPANSSGFNMCPMASAGCKASCLNTDGRGQMKAVQQGRINKTLWLMRERETFLIQLKKEIRDLKKMNEEKNLQIKFMKERLENWSEKNFSMRTGILNMTVDKFISMKNKILEDVKSNA